MDKANLPWTTKQIAKNMETGKATFAEDIQRGLVWNRKQKSLLIHSLLVDYPVPPIYATEEKLETDDGKETTVYSFIDGKQRLNAIYDFIAGKFALDDIPDILLETGMMFDISGMTFIELPEELQDNLMTRSLTVFYYKNATPEEKREMFARLNNGKVLSAIERLKAQAPNYWQIRELGDNKLFNLILTKNQRNKVVDDAIIIRTYLLLCKNEYDMSEVKIRQFIAGMHFEDEDMLRMSNIFDVLYSVLSELKENKSFKKIFTKVKNRTHILGLVVLADSILNENSGDKNQTSGNLKNWIVKFFGTASKDTTVDAEYNKLSGGGSSQPQNVKRRIDILIGSYRSA